MLFRAPIRKACKCTEQLKAVAFYLLKTLVLESTFSIIADCWAPTLLGRWSLMTTYVIYVHIESVRENNLMQVWDIARHFSLCCFKRVVNSQSIGERRTFKCNPFQSYLFNCTAIDLFLNLFGSFYNCISRLSSERSN